MDQIEIILIVVIILAIVFKVIKIFKYFMIIFFLVIALKLLGGFDHPAVIEFNQKYQISQNISNLNDNLGMAGRIESMYTGIIDFFKGEITKVESDNKYQECMIENAGKTNDCKEDLENKNK